MSDTHSDTVRAKVDAEPRIWRVVFDGPPGGDVEVLTVEVRAAMVEVRGQRGTVPGFVATVAASHGTATLRRRRDRGFGDLRDIRHTHAAVWEDAAVFGAACAEGVVFRELVQPGQMTVREMRAAFKAIAALDWIAHAPVASRRPYMTADVLAHPTTSGCDVHSAPEVRLRAAGMLARSCVGIPADGSGDVAADIRAELAALNGLPKRVHAEFPEVPKCPNCGCEKATEFGGLEYHTSPECIPL